MNEGEFKKLKPEEQRWLAYQWIVGCAGRLDYLIAKLPKENQVVFTSTKEDETFMKEKVKEATTEISTKKHRDRPKGSKNKVRTEETQTEEKTKPPEKQEANEDDSHGKPERRRATQTEPGKQSVTLD